MENYFKNRLEVEQFFKNEYFVFLFMTESVMHFETLRPIFLGNELFKFQVAFYYEDGETFFNYSAFNDWLDKFQLSQVIKISEDDNSQETLYFKKYEKTT
jgi:hypothetical protein